jgi:Mg-chelatase subunit ChlD
MLPSLPFRSALPLLLAAGAAAQAGTSTFGDARTRELAALGVLPTARDVVVRDIVDYHRHRLPLPRAGQTVALDVRFDRGAAGDGEEVWLQVGYTTAPQGDRALAPACAVALVVDTSGSMQEAGKLTAVKAGLHAFVDRLRPDDDVALVTFSSEARVVTGCRARADGAWLHDAIDRLEPDASTNLHAGLMYGIGQVAGRAEGAARRVILLTDGIANSGVTDPERILGDALAAAGDRVDVATIGVGQDLDTALLQRLASGCRGLFHFVADAKDVQKVFVAEADALLHPAARGVRLTVELDGGLRALEVAHEGARVERDRVELELPDLNAGVTGVVMVRCRVAGGRGEPGARAELTFADAATRARGNERADASLAIGTREHTVRTGDSLQRIARERLGSAERWRELADANPGLRAERLAVGERLRLPASGVPDLEVRKNAAIAVLAQGLAAMARACDARRWADAHAALLRATDDAARLFPGADDDVQRVRDLAAGHERTLRRYVDRFRDY